MKAADHRSTRKNRLTLSPETALIKPDHLICSIHVVAQATAIKLWENLMTLIQKLLGATAALALSAGAVLAEPALIYDLGGKFDKSFNEAAFNGANVGPKKPAAHIARLSFSQKPSASKLCAVLPKRARTLL